MSRRDRRRERRSHDRLMRRIYALLGSGEWRVAFVRLSGDRKACRRLGVGLNVVGTVDHERGLIIVDHRYDLLATIVHECLHVLVEDRFDHRHHDEEEAEVRRLELLIMRNMGRRQATRLFRLASLVLADALDA